MKTAQEDQKDPVLEGLALVLLLPVVLYGTFAKWKLYGWFAVPLGAPELSFAQVLGLTLLLALVINPLSVKKYDTTTLFHAVITYALFVTVVFIAGGLAR